MFTIMLLFYRFNYLIRTMDIKQNIFSALLFLFKKKENISSADILLLFQCGKIVIFFIFLRLNLTIFPHLRFKREHFFRTFFLYE